MKTRWDIRFRPNYNEFKSHVRWHDYFSLMINEFPILLIRRYDWFDDNEHTLSISFLIFNYTRIYPWKN